MPDPTVRFAAGTPERPRSSVWRLWTHGSDAYLGARVTLGMFKLSMHQSGAWICAFTSQSGVVDETGSRRHHTWQRPAEFSPGWTQGPAVGVPWTTWRDQLPSIEVLPPDTAWVPGPKRNKKVTFSILIQGAGDSSDIRSVSLPGDRVLHDGLSLSNGETVWIQVRYSEMSPDENKGIAAVEREFRGFKVTGSLDSVHAWGLWITTSVNEIPLLVQLPLGRRHITVADEASTSDDLARSEPSTPATGLHAHVAHRRIGPDPGS